MHITFQNIKYVFKIHGFHKNTFKVMQFTGNHHELSNDYCFCIDINTKQDIDEQTLINKQGFISFKGISPYYIQGYITEVSYHGYSLNNHNYSVKLCSRLSQLKSTANNTTFVQKNIIDVITEILLEANWSTEDFRFKLRKHYPKREFIVQYQQNSYEFIDYWLSYYGIVFNFKQDVHRAKLIFYDHLDDLSKHLTKIVLPFQTKTGLTTTTPYVYNLEQHVRLLPKHVQLNDYNYNTPEIPLHTISKNKSHIPSHGTFSLYGLNYKTRQEGENLTKVLHQQIDWQREYYIAKTNCSNLTPGQRITITNHPNPTFNKTYRILSIEHYGKQTITPSTPINKPTIHYYNQLTLIPATITYRKPYAFSAFQTQNITQLKPKIHGITTGKIESPNDQYAYLDEQGRYRIKFNFDQSNKPVAAACLPVRLMQPFGGNQYGMHFPIHANTEVAITCLNNDIDRPIIIGTIPNPSAPTPITSINPTQNIFRTWGGNELLIEDRHRKQHIRLSNPDKQNTVLIDAHKDKHRIKIQSKHGKIEIYAKQDINIHSKDNYTTVSKKDHIVSVENNQHINAQLISYQSGKDAQLEAKKDCYLQSENGDINLSAANGFYIDSDNSLDIQIFNGNLSAWTQQGNIEFHTYGSSKFKADGDSEINMIQGDGQIHIDARGNLRLTANHIKIDADVINIEAKMDTAIL